MGSGFVEACLEYFDHNPERVINSLLEENLPPHLMELDRKTARKKTEAAPSATRSNVFDGDEFDVNSRDRLDMGRVHKGKHATQFANSRYHTWLIHFVQYLVEISTFWDLGVKVSHKDE